MSHEISKISGDAECSSMLSSIEALREKMSIDIDNLEDNPIFKKKPRRYS